VHVGAVVGRISRHVYCLVAPLGNDLVIAVRGCFQPPLLVVAAVVVVLRDVAPVIQGSTPHVQSLAAVPGHDFVVPRERAAGRVAVLMRIWDSCGVQAWVPPETSTFRKLVPAGMAAVGVYSKRYQPPPVTVLLYSVATGV
jgi:hypothetical protein